MAQDVAYMNPYSRLLFCVGLSPVRADLLSLWRGHHRAAQISRTVPKPGQRHLVYSGWQDRNVDRCCLGRDCQQHRNLLRVRLPLDQ